MKDSRIGESLWNIWEGSDIGSNSHSGIVYYTSDHVDLDNELVRRALASSLQRDGLALSLGQGFQMINAGEIIQGFIGVHSDDIDLLEPELCNSDGLNSNDVLLVSITPVTFIDMPEF